MIFFINVSNKYKEKGKQDFIVKIGQPDNSQTLGKFSIDSDATLSEFFKAGSESISNYNRMTEMFLFVNMSKEERKKELEKDKKKVNLLFLTLSNVSEVYSKGGLQQYSIKLVGNDYNNFTHDEIGAFEHLYEDGGAVCLEKAAQAIDPDLKLPSYKQFLKDMDKKKASK